MPHKTRAMMMPSDGPIANPAGAACGPGTADSCGHTMLAELAAVLALLDAQAAGPQGSPSPGGPPCRVSGTVVDGQTRAGIRGASVILRADGETAGAAAARPGGRPADCRERCETVADGDGRFEFVDLAPGAYSLSASVSGFTESAPSRLTLTVASCAVSVDIPYRLQMQAQARADLPRDLGATPIASPIAPTLTGTAIGLTPGALEDLARAFQANPGVAASQDNRNDLLVRGGGALENQTRIDGFDVPNPNHFGAQGGSGGALSILPPWLIERGSLEVGGFSVAFGDRMSSVADISLRPGRQDRVHTMIGAGIGGLMGIVEGAAGPRGSWLVSARRSFLEAVIHDQAGEAIPTYGDVLAKLHLGIGERHRLTVLGLGSRDTASAHAEKAGDDEIAGEENVGLMGVRFDSAWSARSSSTLAASVSSIDVDVSVTDGPIVDALDKGRDLEFRLRADLRRKGTPAGDVLVGAAVKAYRYDYDLYVNDIWTPYETVNRDIAARDTRSFTDVAGYAEVERALPGRGRVLAGIRLDHWGAASVTAGSPRVKAEFVPARFLRVVGYWGIYRQGVPYIWMASAPGNAGLSPIVSQQVGGGFDVAPSPWLRLAVEGFGKRYRNYPVDPVVPSHVLVSSSAEFDSPYVGPLISAGRVRAHGIDSSVQLTPGSRFQLAANYSHWRVRQLGLDGVWRSADHEVNHQGRVEMLFRPDRKWSTGFRWRYASGRPFTPFSVPLSIKRGRAVYDLTKINASDYPAYSRTDLRVDRTFAIRRVAAMAYIEIDNLADRHNVLIYNWSRSLKGPKPVYQWGRTLIAGLRVEF